MTEAQLVSDERYAARRDDEIATAWEHAQIPAFLRRLLNPESVAVVGASRDPASLGYRVMKNLIDGRFPGTIYPINPKAAHVLGVPTYADVTSVPGRVDLAVVATPAPTVCDVARNCAAHDVAGLVVITAGFAETGEEGAQRERRSCWRSAARRACA